MAEPCLPRKRKRPARYKDGDAEAEFSDTPEHHYRVTLYNEAIDLIVNCLGNRFDQPGYRMYSTLEQLLLKGRKGECYDEQMAIISERYANDINTPNLKIQLQTLSTNLETHSDVSLGSVVTYLQGLPRIGRTLTQK